LSAAIFMADAYNNNVSFFLDKEGVVKLNAPNSIWNDAEVMELIRSQKTAIRKQLEQGFDCVRDELSIAEAKTLTAAAQMGCVGRFAAPTMMKGEVSSGTKDDTENKVAGKVGELGLDGKIIRGMK